MKRRLLLLGMVMYSLLCVGCSGINLTPEQSSLQLKKKGEIKTVIVEPFQEPELQLEELQTWMDEEVASYNLAYGEGTVRANKAKLVDGNVVVRMTYQDASHYTRFNGRNLFVGTVAKAREAGYGLQVGLENLEDANEVIKPEQLDELEQYQLLIVEEPGEYRLYGSPEYASHGVTRINRNSVNVSAEMEGIAYILFR